MKKILPQALLIIVFLISCNSKSSEKDYTIAKLNTAAPDFLYETGLGTTKKLSDLKGKVILVTFFATWCGPCRAELPHIEKDIYNRLKNNPNFELLVFGREHDWDEVNGFKAEQQLSMPFYPDKERKIYSLYAKQSIPRNFLIDKNGKIVYLSIGFNEKEFEELKAEIDKQLQAN